MPSSPGNSILYRLVVCRYGALLRLMFQGAPRVRSRPPVIPVGFNIGSDQESALTYRDIRINYSQVYAFGWLSVGDMIGSDYTKHDFILDFPCQLARIVPNISRKIFP